eukprot:gnl/MRDRNA2_/MRDRNA2_59485_c0_seq2.p1 gnl/MRDRNA2_/MRDRNA2_59485_c0~~gnl/MRDRNA2_/MRDRNA2_59485_c0_seq2.p1  ORF type:complete len:399 (+),score=42.41 gnl/MRDRNA2_/MRDRNA2_59485_c0_seq2:82-1278(+)
MSVAPADSKPSAAMSKKGTPIPLPDKDERRVWDEALMETVDKFIGPDFPDDPLVKRSGKLKGKKWKLTMLSKDSKIYPGVTPVKNVMNILETLHEDCTSYTSFGGTEAFPHCRVANAETPEISKPAPYKRKVDVFVPEGVDASTENPFMIFLDGIMYENLGEVSGCIGCLGKFCGCFCMKGAAAASCITFTNTMDNMIKTKELKPMICIFLEPGAWGESIQGSQRGLEYDTVSNTFTEFVEQEVVPFIEKKCKVKLSNDPYQRAVMGTSSGGNAAITMGMSGRFKRVVVSSASCVNLGYPYNPEIPLSGWDYHSGKELIKNREKVEGLRVAMITNELDLMFQMDEKYYFNWVAASLRTAKALKDKGYDCLHFFAKEAIHVDPRPQAHCFPELVKWVWS